jgi:hypothetical protein
VVAALVPVISLLAWLMIKPKAVMTGHLTDLSWFHETSPKAPAHMTTAGKIGATLFLCAVTAISPAAQTTVGGSKAVVVEGLTDCGEWLASRQRQTSAALEEYVLGMLNGLVIGSDREFWRATEPKISRDAAYFWIDNYCRSHPTEQLNDAVITFFSERAK